MASKRRIRIISILCLAVMLCLTGIGVITLTSLAEDNRELPRQVYVGDRVDIPAKNITHNGATKSADVILTDPDGFAEAAGSSFIASKIGLYKLEYYAYFDGVKVSLPEESVLVVRRAVNLFEDNGKATLTQTRFAYNDSYKGVLVQQKAGGTVSLSKIVDISKNTKNDLLLELVIVPTGPNADFSNLNVTLTDAHDEQNKVTISILDGGTINGWGLGTYVKVGAAGQKPAGLEGDIIHRGGQFGTLLWQAFRTVPKDKSWPFSETEEWFYPTLKFYFDYEEKALYMSPVLPLAPSRDSVTKVADLDDPEFFPSSIWDGFTTGEVKISFSATGLTSVTANYMLLNVAGFDLEQEEFFDDRPPQIIIDYEGQTEIPVSAVGQRYKVFNATATDNYDNEVKLDVSAYYLTADGRKLDVSIDDGYIRTNYGGNYLLRYVARDKSGNEAVEEIKVLCIAQNSPISIVVPEIEENYRFFDKVAIPSADEVYAEGGSGNITLSLSITSPSGKKVALKDNAFRAEEIGQYTVEYTATDYLMQSKTVTKVITVHPPQAPIFTSQPDLPLYLIKGFRYKLPVWKAMEADGNGGIRESEVKTYVNGAEVNEAFVAFGTSAEISYVAGQSTAYTVTIPVIDGNGGKDQDKYFIANNVSIAVQREQIDFTFAADAKITFANALSSKNFYLAFSSKGGSRKFEQLNVVLIDANDNSNSVTIKVLFEGENVYLALPHQNILNKFAQTNGDLELYYNNDTFELYDISGNACGKVAFADNGEPFKGFSDAIHMRLEAEKVTGQSLISLSNLNNQPLGYRKSNYDRRMDEIEPVIILKSSYPVKQELNNTAYVSEGVAFDVLSDIISFTVTVTAPDGSVILNEVSAYDSYSFTLTQYGIYRVVYKATDSNYNQATLSKIIRVVENEKPSLSVDSKGIKEKYGVGTKISLPGYTVSDNSDKYTLDVILIMPDNEMKLVMQNVNGTETYYLDNGQTSLTLNKKGKYVLRYFAYDETFNYAMQEIVFWVE